MRSEPRVPQRLPRRQLDELHAYGLEVARERLLKYAEKLEEAER